MPFAISGYTPTSDNLYSKKATVFVAMAQCSTGLISLLLLTLVLAALAPSIPLSWAGITPADISKVGQSPSTGSQAQNVSLTGAYFDHVVVILMENKGIYNICGPSPGGASHCNGNNTSYLDSLANIYALGLNYTSLINTSAPNYVGLIGGSTFGCTAGGCGNLGAITHSNVVDRLEMAGLSWKAYFENNTSSSRCFSSSSPPYNRDHNPFIWFNDIYNNQTRCANLIKANPSSCTITDCALINDLNGPSPPSFAWLTPNDCNDMHGDPICTRNKCLSTNLNNYTICEQDGDAYLKTLVPNILNSTVFKNQRSALFITFDEGTGSCLPNHKTNGDCVYAVWSGPVAKSGGFVSYNRYNHYSFLKTLEFNWNLTSLGTNDTNASVMKDFFSPTFSMSASPFTFSVESAAFTSTVTLTSLSQFNGTVNLTSAAEPSGPTLTFNPTDIMLRAELTNSSTLSFSTASAGDYTVTINATSGTLSHSTTLTISTGTVGGFVIQVNKLRLLGQFLPTGTSILVVLALTLAAVKTARRRGNRRNPSPRDTDSE